jgi:hypothetical protein
VLISRLLVARRYVVAHLVVVIVIAIVVIGFEVDIDAARGHCLGRRFAAVVAIAFR